MRVLPASRRRQGPLVPPLVLAQEAVIASAAVLRMLRDHKTLLPGGTMSLLTEGAHSPDAIPCRIRPATASIGGAAVLGVLQCLPYELPALKSTPISTDGNAPISCIGRGRRIPEQITTRYADPPLCVASCA